MLYRYLLRYIALIVLLVSSINHTAEIIPQPTNKTRFQRLKESSQQKFRRFITDVNDPRNTLDLLEALWDSKDLEEKKQIRRILANKTLAELIALGIVLPPLWYLTRGTNSGSQSSTGSGTESQSSTGTSSGSQSQTRGSSSEPLPTIKLNPYIRTKLSLVPNKNNTYDVFTILHLSQNASIKKIESAYKQLSKTIHSDKALQQEKRKREFAESLGVRVIAAEEFKERLARKRDPSLPPVQNLPSPPLTVDPELLKLYDDTFKVLQDARDQAIEYKTRQ